jgi:hypothetical protein
LIGLALVVAFAFTAPVSKADMYCSNGGWIYWMDHLPYCVASQMSHECMYCSVTGVFTLGEW